MSSASVFNPHVLAELRQIRAPRMNADRLSNQKFTKDISAINSVRRNIFGSVDHDEIRNFVDKELELQRQKDSQFWGFDFKNEIPLPGIKNRFVWEAIPQKITERPQKRPIGEEYDISHLYPQPIEDFRETKFEEEFRRDNIANLDKIAKVRAKGQSLITGIILVICF